MRAGFIVAKRFELLEAAGEGGMGTVWRARDRMDGRTVAVKLLHVAREKLAQFFREAAVLAELRHPNIVGYVDHGVTAEVGPYLAMDWLDGEALDARLGRTGRLTIDEAITVARRVLPALAAAHHRGIVHRDLKPANLYLPAGDLAQVKLLDFGVAKRMLEESANGKPRTTAGTPYYMSPEQARGEPDLDGRSDVFSLGSVLYEALTGTRPFRGDTIPAVLAKVCVADPPRLRELLPEAPAALEALLDRMLAKRAGDRPADVEELDAAFARLQGGTTGEDSITLDRLSQGEQRVMCLLMAARSNVPPPALVDDATPDLPPAGGAAATNEDAAAVAGAANEFGGQLHALVDGSWVVTVGEHGTPKDQAMRAARCALALRRLAPSMAFAIGMGRAVVLGRLPLGPVIDHTIDRLRGASAGPILIGDEAATLLAHRFDVSERPAGGFRLDGEHDTAVALTNDRRGRTPFVGRSRELATLVGAFHDAVDESHARAIIVQAGAGSGKSRLRSELVAQLEEDGQRFSRIHSEADPLRAGVPFGLAAGAFAAAIGVSPDEPIERRRERVLSWARERVSGDDVDRVAAMIGELVGAAFPDDAHPLLRTSRQDPKTFGEQVAFAAADAIRGEARTRPVLLVLDDVHWADGPSLALFDLVLREAFDSPLFLLALARPELDEEHPKLWDGRGVDRLSLRPLSKQSCRKLLLDLLGEDQELLAAAIAEKAEGNPLFIEELARVAQRRGSADLPDAVLGTIQARLDDLPGPARKVLRAASIFGASFTRDGLAVLLEPAEAAELPAWLDELGREDLLIVADDRPLAFRHALVRDAAYQTLTDGDRILGHRLVARWLESSGRADPAVLVEHHERGGDRPRAILWCGNAARQALAVGDLDGAVKYARRGADSGATGVDLGTLRLAEANALRNKGEGKPSASAAERAMNVLTKGSATWLQAANCAAHVLSDCGDVEGLEVLARTVETCDAAPDAQEHQILALATIGCALLRPRPERGRTILAHVFSLPATDVSFVTSARLAYALARLALSEQKPSTVMERTREALQHALRADNAPLVAELRIALASFAMDVGAYDEAEHQCRQTMAFALRVRSRMLEGLAAANLGTIACVRGRTEEAMAHAKQAVGAFSGLGLHYFDAALKVVEAHIALAGGDESTARRNLEGYFLGDQVAPGYQPWALALQASISLREGDVTHAVTLSHRAVQLIDVGGLQPEEGEMFARQVQIEALLESGDVPGAREACSKVYDGLERRAATIDDAHMRRSFRESIPSNARVIALAHELGLARSAAVAGCG